MDNIRYAIKILFQGVSPNEVLLNNIEYDEISRNRFLSLGRAYLPWYSGNELGNMYEYLCNEFEWHNNKMCECIITNEKLKFNVFDALILFADSVLVEHNGAPLCSYENLLRWRDMCVALDEDLFITSFLAYKDAIKGIGRHDFFWPPVIGHNNKSLNRLLEKGVAENHFHLKGSAPLFHLSWISLMNNVCNPAFKRTFDKYEEMRLHMKVAYDYCFSYTSLYTLWIQAAVIRLILFSFIVNDAYILEDKKGQLYDWLKDPAELEIHISDIQSIINDLRDEYAKKALDYSLCKNYLLSNPNEGVNEIISGERWLMYSLFYKVYSTGLHYEEANLLYAYILMKETIRSEMIQVNNHVGFDNFLEYQNRKDAFIDNTPFEDVYLRMAVRDTILNQHIVKLEARIAPKNRYSDLKKAIRRYDEIISGSSKFKKKYFFVVHFIKEKDGELERKEFFSELICRHNMKREQVKKQAHVLLEFRRGEKKLGKRIRGIDASSEEIVCRPEVFAQAFRFLKNEPVVYRDVLTGTEKKLQDLCVTYHVGEDFLDIVDGMRAIDEAVSFLNMHCGDRLGHALALGVDVQEWYASKEGCILISQQDYLDNLVWLYAKIRKFCLEDCEDTIRYIEKRYDEYFRIVYLNNIPAGRMDIIADKANGYYEDIKLEHTYWSSQCGFSINTYYDSWKLRGDDPFLYEEGFFKIKDRGRSEWDEYGINKVFPENYRIRYNPEAAFLYHTYHFNPSVKEEGSRKKEIKIHPCIIKAAKKVQKRMQWFIAQKGLEIETNPSSNALIGTFKRYDKHPIVNWYNDGLTTDFQDIADVPQIRVSINTDDQGVFATYIENEYAFLALALEKLRDESGKPQYSRTMIYNWIDKIREMGLGQSFEHINRS